MSKRFDSEGNKLPRGVCLDKEREGHYRATYKGHSVRCATLEEAVLKRHELVKAAVPHPKYVEWNRKRKLNEKD